jgi:hypothetical protein
MEEREALALARRVLADGDQSWMIATQAVSLAWRFPGLVREYVCDHLRGWDDLNYFKEPIPIWQVLNDISNPEPSIEGRACWGFGAVVVKGEALDGWDFEDMYISNISLEESCIKNTTLKNVVMANSGLWDVEFQNCNFGLGMLAGLVSEGLSIERTNMDHADLKFSKHCNLVLHDVSLRYADLQYADLEGASFRNVDLRGACLSCANLLGVKDYGGNKWPLGFDMERLQIWRDLENVSVSEIGIGIRFVNGAWERLNYFNT